MDSQTEPLSTLIERAQQGDRRANHDLYRFAFPRLRKIASSLLRRERPAHTLQPTALVGEVFLKLHRIQARILGEDHFFHIAARAMRQVLIDYARVRGPVRGIPLDEVPRLLVTSDEADREALLVVRGVFEALREVDPRAAATVWLRCVEGRTLDEVCRLQNRGIWRVRTDYDFGVRWMAKRLRPPERSVTGT